MRLCLGMKNKLILFVDHMYENAFILVFLLLGKVHYMW